MKTKTHRQRRQLLAVSITATLSAGHAMAQDDNWSIEEIIVTAQKREQSLQDVPLSVSAFSAGFMETTKMDDAKDLVLLTPGLNNNTSDSFLDSISVRGISTNDFGVGAEPSIGVYVDGIYQGRTGGALTSFFDVERSEVIKGPQGTLFGRNAASGAISITTNKPQEVFEGSLQAGFAEQNHSEFSGMINMPLTDHLFLRAAAYHEKEDGYIDNLEGGDDLLYIDKQATRVSLRYTGIDDVDMIFAFEYEDRESNGTVYRAVGTDAPRDSVRSDLGDDSKDEGEVYGLTGTVIVDLNEDFSLTSITGVRGHNYTYLEDFDGTAATVDNFSLDQSQKYYSQEFRLNYDNGGAVSWFVGASAYREELEAKLVNQYDEDTMCALTGNSEEWYVDYTGGGIADCDDLFAAPAMDWLYDYLPGEPFGLADEISQIDATYEGWGVYGDFTWHATDKLDVTAGVRYTVDKRDFGLILPFPNSHLGPYWTVGYATDGEVRDIETWNNISPRLALNYNLNEQVSLYANISRGYKAGGFNSASAQLPVGEVADDYYQWFAPNGTKPQSFEEEEVTNYELGMKSQWWGNRLQVNVSTFQYDYEGLQVNYFDSNVSNSVVTNVGDAEGRGVELDLRALPTENLDIYVAVAYLDTELTKLEAPEVCATDCIGNPLGSPELTTSLVGTYTWPLNSGEVYFTVENFYQSSFHWYLDRTADEQESIDITNLRLGYVNPNNWEVNVYVENALDEFYYQGGYAASDVLPETKNVPGKPRVYGVDFRMTF